MCKQKSCDICKIIKENFIGKNVEIALNIDLFFFVDGVVKAVQDNFVEVTLAGDQFLEITLCCDDISSVTLAPA
jgi:hypothetical protein